jgi:hypothetical protein
MNKEIACSGITYDEIFDIIEYIADVKASQYGSISFLDQDDIRQEVRMKCWEIIRDEKYDPNRSAANLKTFLTICADNRIRDIKRGLVYKYNKPCIRCEFYNKEADLQGRHDCIAFLDKSQCKPYRNHQKYIYAKLSGSHPASLYGRTIIDDKSSAETKNFEFIDYIETKIPEEFYNLFVLLKDSNFDLKCLGGADRAEMVKVLKKILMDYRQGDRI